MAYPGLGIVSNDAEASALPRDWRDSVGMRDASAAAKCVEASRERRAADEREDRVDAVWRECASDRFDVVTLAVHHQIDAQTADEGNTVLS